VCIVTTEKKACSSDSRFRRELSETTGQRLLGTQKPQMVWLTAWVWFSLTTEFASKTGVGTIGLFLCYNGNGGQDRERCGRGLWLQNPLSDQFHVRVCSGAVLYINIR